MIIIYKKKESYYKSYTKALKWHLLIDFLLLVGIIFVADWIFRGRKLYQVYLDISIGIIAFIHAWIVLFYFIDAVLEKKWLVSLGAIIHLIILAIFLILSYWLLIFLVGAPSVGEASE